MGRLCLDRSVSYQQNTISGTPPIYSQLKTFGCLCYCTTSPKQRHKFQPRSKGCLFLGYSYGYKGYKLMDLESNKVFISRNVIFHEDLFPLAKELKLEDSLKFFTPKVSVSSGNSFLSSPPLPSPISDNF